MSKSASSSESETDKMVVDESGGGGGDNEVVSSNQPNPRPSSTGSASSGHGSERGRDKSLNPQNMPDHTYSDAAGNESPNTSAASSPKPNNKNENNSSSENDRGGSPRPRKKQKTNNNGGDVSSSSENKQRLSSPNSSKRHHHRSNASNASSTSSKKSKDKSANNSSSDSEDDKMVVDESVDSEAVFSSSGRPQLAQSTTINSASSANSSAALKSNAEINTSLKVPPLRIVINSTGSNANQVQSCGPSGSTSQLISNSDNSEKVSSSLMPPVSYAVSSSTTSTQEKVEDSGSDSEAVNQSGNSNSTSGTTPGRVTRSSQRAALQQQEKGHGDGRGRRARDGDSDSNKEFGEGQVTSPTSSKECKDTDKEVRAKRKVRIKGQSGGQTDKSGKQIGNEQDDDNDSTSSSTSSGAGGNSNAASTLPPVPTNGQQTNKEFQMPSYNSYQMYLNIRKQVDKRHQQMFSVQPKAPQGFKDYLLNRGSYLLEGKINGSSTSNGNRSSLPTLTTPPSSLKPGSALYILYEEQERARQKVRIQHVIEKEKLRLSAEQEILRVHGRAALAMANQSVPFSVCTILKDDEIYNVIEPENDAESQNFQNASNSKNDYQKSSYHSNSSNATDLSTLTGGPGMPGARSRYNGRLFLSWLQDVDDKWEKIKEETIMRQRRESESLMAIQKLDWEWKMKEIGLCDFKVTPCIEKSFIPVVEVPFDFELLPS